MKHLGPSGPGRLGEKKDYIVQGKSLRCQEKNPQPVDFFHFSHKNIDFPRLNMILKSLF